MANEEAYRHFSETLQAELVQNVKPVIMSLTMLAEDYSESSAYVAKAIEEYITKVTKKKLRRISDSIFLYFIFVFFWLFC